MNRPPAKWFFAKLKELYPKGFTYSQAREVYWEKFPEAYESRVSEDLWRAVDQRVVTRVRRGHYEF
jgi:hypothetical protein